MGENTVLKEEVLLFKEKYASLEEKLIYFETEHEKLMGYLRAMKQDKLVL